MSETPMRAKPPLIAAICIAGTCDWITEPTSIRAVVEAHEASGWVPVKREDGRTISARKRMAGQSRLSIRYRWRGRRSSLEFGLGRPSRLFASPEELGLPPVARQHDLSRIVWLDPNQEVPERYRWGITRDRAGHGVVRDRRGELASVPCESDDHCSRVINALRRGVDPPPASGRAAADPVLASLLLGVE